MGDGVQTTIMSSVYFSKSMSLGCLICERQARSLDSLLHFFFILRIFRHVGVCTILLFFSFVNLLMPAVYCTFVFCSLHHFHSL